MAHKSKTRGIHSDLFGYVGEVIPKVTKLLKNQESFAGRQTSPRISVPVEVMAIENPKFSK